MKCNTTRWLRIRILTVFLVFLMILSAGCASKIDVKPTQTDEVKSVIGPNRITDIRTIEDAESISVIVKGDRLLTYTSVKQPSPPAVLLYFPETTLDDITTEYRLEGDPIRTIKALEINVRGTTTRIEIALTEDVPYSVDREGTGLKVSFQKHTPLLSSAITPETRGKPEGPLDIGNSMKSETHATRLHSIFATPLENSVKITVQADGVITGFRSFPVYNPARIVFDLPKISSPYRREQILPVNTKWVKQVRHYQYPDKTRLVLDTTGSTVPSFTASPVKTGLVIYVGSGAAPTAGTREGRFPATFVKSESIEPDAPEMESALPVTVDRIDFISEKAGKSSILIGTTEPVEYEIKRTSGNRLLLQLFRTRLPGYRQRPLITTRFESAVNRIVPIQTPAMKETAHFIIELREAVPYFVEQTDRVLQIHFEASSVPPRIMATSELPPWEQVLSESSEAETGFEQPDDMIRASRPGSMKKYSGEKIALDFYETDIKNVFRILRKISGKNFAIDRDVDGKVTLALDKPVPWDQVLDLILKMNQLGKVSEGDIVRIATIGTLKNEEADKRAEEAEKQKAKEEMKALEPLLTEYLPVSYSNAKNEIMPHIEKILTKERGSISVDDRSNLIIITDVAEKIEQAKQLVNRLDTVTPQVIIQARIVEASTNFSRDIGTDWTLIGGIQSTDANAGIGPQRGYDALGGTYGWDAAMNFPASITGSLGSTLGFNFTRIAGAPFLLNAKLRAMEAQGKGRIVSAPKIVTLDNKKAIIKQGLEYPYLERDKDGNATRKFKDIDLSLEVTPHITPDHRISMTLSITKNDIGDIINNEQSFTTKEAQTELLVNDGETIVIGGIIKTRSITGTAGLPGLSKMPFLGWLFKSESNSSQKEELLIFITPTIVQLEQR